MHVHQLTRSHNPLSTEMARLREEMEEYKANVSCKHATQINAMKLEHVEVVEELERSFEERLEASRNKLIAQENEHITI